MARKIILFLSYKAETAKQFSFVGPEGIRVSGIQTNVAPVRYLMTKYPDIEEVICIVTAAARETAWEYFQDTIHGDYPGLKITEISYEEESNNFSQAVIPAILSHMNVGDGIFLETTGGFRNANMYLLLVSQVLSQCGYHTDGAVYANLQRRAGEQGDSDTDKVFSLEDVSNIVDMFDLVSGLRELTNLGQVGTLKEYYKEQNDPLINRLLECMENLTESISLCRTSQNRLTQQMDAFNQALEEARASTHPLIRPLLETFQKTFGKKMSLPMLLRWCVRNNMIQQALTIFTEEIPRYIFNRGDLLIRTSDARIPKKKDYEDEFEVQFRKGFLMLSQDDRSIPGSLRSWLRASQTQLISAAYGGPAVHPPDNLAPAVDNLLEILRLACPNNGAYNPSWISKAAKAHRRGGIQKLQDLYGSLPTVNSAKELIQQVSNLQDRTLRILLSDVPARYQILTIQNLQSLVEHSSGYIVKCSYEQMANISRDYLYIKTLRNLANHASEETNQMQNLLSGYLTGQFGYVDPKKASLKDIGDAIGKALDHLKPITQDRKAAQPAPAAAKPKKSKSKKNKSKKVKA